MWNIRPIQKFNYISVQHQQNKMQLKFSKNSKGVKYLGITLTNDVQDFCVEFSKTLSKDIKDVNKWRPHHVYEQVY